MENITRFCVKMKVEFAVMVFDDFTGRQLKGSQAKITVPGVENFRLVVKPDGYFVMLSGPEKIEKIMVSAYGFETEMVDIDHKKICPDNPIVRVRMRPDRCYPLRTEHEWLEGCTIPGTVVQAACRTREHQLKLLMDYKKGGKELCIFPPGNENYEGKTFAIYVKGKLKEIVTLQERVSEKDSIYKLYGPLNGDYKKLETVLCPICKAVADKEGKYFMPVKGTKEEIDILNIVNTDNKTEIKKRAEEKDG